MNAVYEVVGSNQGWSTSESFERVQGLYGRYMKLENDHRQGDNLDKVNRFCSVTYLSWSPLILNW